MPSTRAERGPLNALPALTVGVALVLAEVRTKDVTRVIERNVD